jgi:hypothetical protein
MKKSKEQFILVKISSKENSFRQLSQILKDELKAEAIQGYEIEPIEKIKWQISEGYESKLIGDYDDEEEAREQFEILTTSGDGGDYFLEKIIS